MNLTYCCFPQEPASHLILAHNELPGTTHCSSSSCNLCIWFMAAAAPLTTDSAAATVTRAPAMLPAASCRCERTVARHVLRPRGQRQAARVTGSSCCSCTCCCGPTPPPTTTRGGVGQCSAAAGTVSTLNSMDHAQCTTACATAHVERVRMPVLLHNHYTVLSAANR
jgi:hypothetical protein